MPRMTIVATALAVAMGIVDPAGQGADHVAEVDSLQLKQHHPATESEHRHLGKPGAPLWLVGPSLYRVEINQPQVIGLQLHNGLGAGEMSITLAADPGLSLLSESQWQLNLSDQAPIALTLEVIANTPGEHFVHVFVDFVGASGQTSSRALAVSVTTESDVQAHFYKSARPSDKAPEWIRLPSEERIY